MPIFQLPSTILLSVSPTNTARSFPGAVPVKWVSEVLKEPPYTARWLLLALPKTAFDAGVKKVDVYVKVSAGREGAIRSLSPERY